jgi:hypothetical protein
LHRGVLLLTAVVVSLGTLFVAMGVGSLNNDVVSSAALGLVTWLVLPPLMVGRLARAEGIGWKRLGWVLLAHGGVMATSVGLGWGTERAATLGAFVLRDGVAMALVGAGPDGWRAWPTR